MKERKTTYKNELKTINKMAIRRYILIITLNVNGLNPKDIDWQHGYKTRPGYVVFKRPTSDLGTD